MIVDGRISDSQGRAVDFRNTIIIMTSNIGGEDILELAQEDSQYEQMRKKVLQALRQHFRPEFLNRIDDLIIFHALRREELGRIITIQLRRIENLLSQQKITIKLTRAAQDYLVEVGYDPVYGARPLKRAIQRELENPIATKILEMAFGEGDTILVDCVENQLVFKKEEETRSVEVEVVSS